MRNYKSSIPTVENKKTMQNPNSISVFTGKKRKVYRFCPNIMNRYHDCSDYCRRWKHNISNYETIEFNSKSIKLNSIQFKSNRCRYGKWCKNKEHCKFDHT